MEEEEINEDEIVSDINAVSTFEHVTSKQMSEEQQKDPTLELVYKLVTTGQKPKTSAIAKIKSKAVRKYLLQFDRLTLKKGVLHRLYIHNDVEFHQMVLPIKFQAQVLRLLHDGQGHQGIERTIALCWERFYWNTMFQDVTRYVKECPRCPRPMIQLATSHMSLCLVAKLQLCATRGLGWQIIMTTFRRASVHG